MRGYSGLAVSASGSNVGHWLWNVKSFLDDLFCSRGNFLYVPPCPDRQVWNWLSVDGLVIKGDIVPLLPRDV